MLSAEAIAKAKLTTPYADHVQVLHQHDDCVRIAYQWLDAQVKTRRVVQRSRPIKHIIESWAGRYVSQNDVEVAAHMHPRILGRYPRFNISARLLEPNLRRLIGIAEAGQHPGYRDRYAKVYENRTEP
jgi:hypothetical protein